MSLWRLMLVLLYVDPFLTSQRYDIRISTRGTNRSVLLALMLMLMSPVFSVVHMSLYLCLCLCACENQALRVKRRFRFPSTILVVMICFNT